MRDILIEFMDSLRDYVAESRTNIAHDERDSSEFVDIFLNQGQSLPIDSVVGSYNLKVGDKIKMPSGLRAEVIKTKVKVKDEFGGEYYLSDIEVG